MSERAEAGATHLRALGGLWLLAVIASGSLVARGSSAFAPYFGPIQAILGTATVVGLGLVSLAFLQQRGWFVLHRGARGWLVVPLVVAVPFALPVIGLDLLGGFPPDINVTAPESLLFYPVIALVAESVFHLAPLAVLLPLLGRVLQQLDRERLVFSSVVAVALIEPMLQVVWGVGQSPWWTNAYVGFHVLAINLVGLHLFRRFGFVSAYLFRVAYYLVWHVLWGHVRLSLLFGG
ncbi:MAG: hypothetical protein HKO76_05125 [Acidimicrobiia bacterium]|nr:hypothetical protein [Acidimicrobiia bacterium]